MSDGERWFGLRCGDLRSGDSVGYGHGEGPYRLDGERLEERGRHFPLRVDLLKDFTINPRFYGSKFRKSPETIYGLVIGPHGFIA